MDYKEIAERLIIAEENHYAVSCITQRFPHFDVSMGYKVQDELIKIKRAQRHEILAYKMGLTSEAKMRQMQIDNPIYGAVFDYMRIPNQGEMFMEEFIHPKVEAEIAFILAEELGGPDVTGADVLAKTKAVFPAFEIIDSRYEQFKFKLPDVIADNTSASRVVFGDQWFEPKEFDLKNVRVSLSINGEIKAEGTSDAVLGNPADSVAMLANMLYSHGKGKLPKGSVILTGGITEAILLKKGDHVISSYDGMGEISFYVR